MSAESARLRTTNNSRVPQRWLSVFCATFLGISLVGCSGDKLEDLRSYVEQTKAKSGGRIEPLPEVKPFETYVYKTDGRISPFEQSRAILAPLQVASSLQALQPNTNRRKEPLEGFPLEGLRMVGTLGRGAGIWAVIKAPDGIVYRVTQGNYIGQNNGRILRVSEQKVELTELVPDGLGAWKEHQTSLDLAE